jgi:hypothetical protein
VNPDRPSNVVINIIKTTRARGCAISIRAVRWGTLLAHIRLASGVGL